MQERRSNIGWFFLLLLTVLILGSAWLYTNWQAGRTVLPTGLTVSGLDVGGMTREQALNAIVLAYTAPITVYYQDQTTQLLPEMVDLAVDLEATQANLDEVLSAQQSTEGFFAYTLDRLLGRERRPEPAYAIVNYSRERVDAFLERMAQKYDREAEGPVPIPEAGIFRPPRQGTHLDIDASRPLLIRAILAAAQAEREVHLVVRTDPAPAAAIGMLHTAVEEVLADVEGEVGVFAKHLATGQELCVQCEAVFPALAPLRLGIALELYRRLDAPPDAPMTSQLRAMLVETDTVAAEQLLAYIGDGDTALGATRVNELLREARWQQSLIVAHADGQTATPAPQAQTTPLEVGLMMEEIARCAQGGGTLRLLYPHRLTPQECRSMLALLRSHPASTPPGRTLQGVPIAHVQGRTETTYADVALLGSTEEGIVLAVYLQSPLWTTWEEARPTFEKIGQLTYTFFVPR